MVDLFRQLADDADDIADRYRREAAKSAAERDQIKTRLAQLDDIERMIGHLAGRLSALKNGYLRRDRPLCPDCALHDRQPSLMQATPSDAPSTYDSFVCPSCGHYTTVSFKEWGTHSAGFSSP